MCVSVSSFAGAADRLALTPAAVSLRIRSLEAELGQRLFTRVGRRVVPTQAAVTLACQVRRALDDINNALDAFQAGITPLRVTVPPTFASRFLAPRLSGYRAAGGATIELDISSDVRDPTAFDVAIRTGRGGWDGLDEYPLNDGLLVAPLATVLKGPDWYFALIREGDQRPASRSFCAWLCEQVRRSQD